MMIWAGSQHRNFAFVTFSTNSSALDAVDNMHLNVLPSNPSKTLKVNLARPAKGGGPGGRVGGLAPGATVEGEGTGWGSRKAVWESEDWLRDNEGKQGDPAGAEGAAVAGGAEGQPMQTGQ